MHRILLIVLFSTISIAGIPELVSGQRPDPNDPHIKAVNSLQKILESREFLVSKVNDLASNQSLQTSLTKAHAKTRGIPVADIMLSSKTKGTFTFELQNSAIVVDFTLSKALPVKLVSLSMKTDSDGAPQLELTWDNVESQLAFLKDQGISGAILLARKGEIVLHKGFGLANRKNNTPNDTDTIFAIGSAPIDFTHAGILWLRDNGKLRLDDLITKYFENVPDDKKQSPFVI